MVPKLQWFSKRGPQTSSISSTWEPVRNADDQVPPRQAESASQGWITYVCVFCVYLSVIMWVCMICVSVCLCSVCECIYGLWVCRVYMYCGVCECIWFVCKRVWCVWCIACMWECLCFCGVNVYGVYVCVSNSVYVSVWRVNACGRQGMDLSVWRKNLWENT